MPCRQFFHVDAFTSEPFRGNPAAVVVLKEWLPDTLLQQFASEFFLPETAFVVPLDAGNKFHLRWFTPDLEMDLCGHATLATAHILCNELNYGTGKLLFQTASGELSVEQRGDLLWLDFPSRPGQPAICPPEIETGIGDVFGEVLLARDYMLIFDNEGMIQNLHPDQTLLSQLNLGQGGIIATAPGNKVDFVSRFFTPGATIFEDPVTGSAHCTLIPYWSKRLGKREMTARQLSSRGGDISCINLDRRVGIGGKAVTVFRGTF
ncbi:MAG TPA: isomerase [Bacteroidales bacterium]|nr:MAG: hypothetical protein A2X11_16290 [Bacteroidetes bacterium GWE2_42_24]OFY29172.1 MAG: hypothetical protein A2X09_05545 [Bacteroidetes bacterium GWF2_43_11]HAQ65546.1 isomerase [Bacteroidales bacterium]HBZ66849.1 isomerase [Bacteroidales bacterium]